MNSIIEVLVPLILIAGFGYVFALYKKIDLSTIANLVIYVTGPCLAFSMLADQPFYPRKFFLMAAAAMVVILGAGLVVLLVSRLFKLKISPAFYLPVMFMNSGNIGFPVAMLAIGYSALSFATIYNLINVIVIFSLGIFIISPKSDKLKFLKIPFIYAVLAGLLISMLRIDLPMFFSSTIRMVGQATIPLSLFLVGYRLRSSRIKPEQMKLSLLASALRIGLGFLLALAFIKIFNIDGLVARVIMISSATPAAIMNVAIAQEYDVETDFMATTITVSTLLSIITIPLVLWFIA